MKNLSPATWKAVSKLLDEALDLPEGARLAWLEQLGRAQPELAPTVRRLLEAHADSETDELLQHLPAPPARDAARPDGLVAGERVGPYLLVRELGRGGMADVWLAERADGAFQRDVALKLPLLTRLRRDLAIRFTRERDILARLEHPHIARLYDAGVTGDGLPYLAMEYVDGLPIGEYCDGRRLDIVARVHLFMQALDAVQYAHANLVIHRDLKPSNILVTAEGQVRLLDFGIAKLLAVDETSRETLLTQLGGRAFTPDYASPEQIKGEPLTIASDIYSLGVVFYELLTGKRPYRLHLGSLGELEQAIVAVEAPKPSSVVSTEIARLRSSSTAKLVRALAGDLDTIVSKALSKTPAQRYSTVAEFGEDLRRHQAGLPVRARPASLPYRARRFVARNRLAVGAGAAVSFALIAATAISLGQARVARLQAEVAAREAKRAEEVKRFVVSVFETADENYGATRKTTAAELLKAARERLDATQVMDDAIRVELLTTIGSGLHGLGEFNLAAPVLAEAVQIAAAKLPSGDRAAAHARVIYAFVLIGSGDTAQARQHLDAAEVGMRQNGEMTGLAVALRGKAHLLAREGKFDGAIELAREAVRAAERQAAPINRDSLLDAYLTVATLTRVAGRNDALETARRAYELAHEVHGDRPRRQVLSAQLEYASALAAEGNAEEALAHAQTVLRLASELRGSAHPDLMEVLRRIGTLSVALGDPVTGIESSRKALEMALARADGKPTFGLGSSRFHLASMLASAHRYEAALAQWREADAVYSNVAGTGDYYARLARSNAAAALTKLGRLDEAERILAARLERPFGTPKHDMLVKRHLGMLRAEQGRHAEAEALLREVAKSFADERDYERRVHSVADLGHVLVSAGKAAESLEYLHEAHSLMLRNHRNGSPGLADVSLDIARAQIALDHGEDAVAAARDAVSFWRRFEPAHREAGVALLWLARAHACAGNLQQAGETLRQATTIIASAGLAADTTLLKETRLALAGSRASKDRTVGSRSQ